MMNGVSLVFHYRLLFYVGVNSNGGIERRGKRREEGMRRGEKMPSHLPPLQCLMSLNTHHSVSSQPNINTRSHTRCLSETDSSRIPSFLKSSVSYLALFCVFILVRA